MKTPHCWGGWRIEVANIMNDTTFQELLTQLKAEDGPTRYRAMCELARQKWPVQDPDRAYWDAYHAVWSLTKDIDPYIRHNAGIAASMISARHAPPGGMFENMPIPDFLPEYGGEVVVSFPKLPGLNSLRRLMSGENND